MKPLTKYLTLSGTVLSSTYYYSEVNNSLYEQHNEYYKNIDNEIKYLKLKNNLSTDFKSPKYPIILCHGLSGFSSVQILPSLSQIRGLFGMDSLEEAKGILCIDYWHGIKEKLEENGCKVFIAKVSPYVWVDLTVDTLISGIKDKPYKVLSVTTISTPHKGSEVADALTKLDTLLPEAFAQLTTTYVDKFNKEFPKDKDVKYFSYGAYCWPKWYNFFYITWKYLFYHNEDVPLEKQSERRVSNFGQCEIRRVFGYSKTC
ncbi:unnamed protein product [Hanseniaspora opuntiae]